MIEWPKEEKEPTKYWLSSLPDDIGFSRLVDLAKLRWRIERDYQELKQEVGLGHFEGRGWRGFHHHASLCIAAYGFAISEQETPLRTAFLHALPSASPSRRLSTPRRHRSGLSATFRTRSPLCGEDGRQPSSGACRDVHVARGTIAKELVTQ
jgi:Transposase DDE domain